ncbi:hypothetical protein [Sulfurisoma sediminicola]|uniref:Uncharacterized protein n=1 Tax=Sulfurisoma sediminicola TaxID=1381557 RepID=A0A497XAL4_9PROT|nr:hypothetical protein [Sulfurisoma sediminicola]RLJ62676.1 hypothetical protein DFR35_2492 [Sulfurisoma sediminicola]
MSHLATMFAGITLGAFGWGISHWVSGQFEPLDSGAGFLATQIVLAPAAAIAGYRKGIAASFVLVVGGYIGLNGYAYVFGGSESRVWAMRGAISTLLLIIVPAVAGLLGGVAKRLVTRFRRGNETPS